MLLKLLISDPITFLLIFIPLLYSLVLHELAHAVCASKFGDDTAKNLGRFSLNPFKHLEPIGTALFLIFGFGWAKPVPIDYSNLKPQKTGIILCSLAGVFTNFTLAFLALLIFKTAGKYFDSPKLYFALLLIAQINLILASFNILPIPPLDGSRVLAVLSPPSLQRFIHQIERFGIIILFALLYIGALDGLIDIIHDIFMRIITLLI